MPAQQIDKQKFLKEMETAGHHGRTVIFVDKLWAQKISQADFLNAWRAEVRAQTHPNATSDRRGMELYQFLRKFNIIGDTQI